MGCLTHIGPIGDGWKSGSPDIGWRVEYAITERDGALVITEVHITPMDADDPPEGGLTARQLRRVPMGNGLIARALPDPGNRAEAKLIEQGAFSEEALSSARRSRGHARSDRWYAEVAREYDRLVRAGTPSPIKDLCAVLADRGLHYSAAGVRELLSKARRRGLLEDTHKGRAGGQLTDRAREVLGS